MNGKNRFGVWLVLGASVALAACGRSGGSAASTALCRQDVDCDEGLTCRKGLCVDASSLDGIGGAAGATDASEGGGAPPAAGGRAERARLHCRRRDLLPGLVLGPSLHAGPETV